MPIKREKLRGQSFLSFCFTWAHFPKGKYWGKFLVGLGLARSFLFKISFLVIWNVSSCTLISSHLSLVYVAFFFKLPLKKLCGLITHAPKFSFMQEYQDRVKVEQKYPSPVTRARLDILVTLLGLVMCTIKCGARDILLLTVTYSHPQILTNYTLLNAQKKFCTAQKTTVWQSMCNHQRFSWLFKDERISESVAELEHEVLQSVAAGVEKTGGQVAPTRRTQ